MMPFTVARPPLLALLLLAPAGFWAWRRWPPPLPAGQSRLALALRSALVVALVLALAGVRVATQPDRRALVAVVDLSDSARAGEPAAARAVAALAGAKGHDDLFGVVTFGRNAQVELPPTRTPVFDGFQTDPDPGYSDIAAAVQLAANLVPEGYGRQLVLLSDGRQNLGDAAAAVAGVRAQGVRVDVVPIGAAPRAEAAVLALEAPPLLRAGQELAVTARLRSTAPAAGALALQLDGREVARHDLSLPAGASDDRFDLGPLGPGVHRLRAALDVRPDGHAQNDVGEAVVRVLGRPAVLVLEGAPGAAANVTAALGATGMAADVRRVEDGPPDPSALMPYDSVVVVDAPADAFPARALEAIATSVRDLGRGLVAVGGSRSYGPGGWQATPLEEALPVRMEVPVPRQRPAVAVAVVMETMESPEGDRVALGATRSVVDQLTPADELAVVDMHHDTAQAQKDGSYVAVPLAPVRDKSALMAQIEDIELGDPPGYGHPLQLALDALEPSAAATKHVVLIGDGDATADVPAYDALLAGARAAGITVTVVGVDTHASAGYMDHVRLLAQLGGGRFYLSRNASEVPQVLLKASRATLRPWFAQEPFFPRVTSAGDLLAGVALDAFPQLGGHVVTSAKAAADVALSSPAGDPVLAGWQYGLGRSVAWTSDAQGRWTGGFLASPVSGALFARMVAWSLPPPTPEGLRLEAVPAGDGLDVTVTAPEPGGDVDVEVLGPEGSRTGQRLRTVAPSRWAGRARVDRLGTYVVHAVLERAGSAVAQAEVAVAVPYSPEYLELGGDDGLLRRLARRGGALLTRPAGAWSERLPPLSVTTDAFWPLLLLAALIWPADVAVRRLDLSPRQALAVLRAVVTFRRPAEVEVVVPPTLSRLRERVEGHRRGSPPSPP